MRREGGVEKALNFEKYNIIKIQKTKEHLILNFKFPILPSPLTWSARE